VDKGKNVNLILQSLVQGSDEFISNQEAKINYNISKNNKNNLTDDSTYKTKHTCDRDSKKKSKPKGSKGSKGSKSCQDNGFQCPTILSVSPTSIPLNTTSGGGAITVTGNNFIQFKKSSPGCPAILLQNRALLHKVEIR